MSEFGEALGTATEGGLFARTFGGKNGTLTDKDGHPLDKGHFSEGACLNCGEKLLGVHCHACGQKAHLHRTIGAFVHDLLHGALHLDGKIWRTLPKLAFKPGELTRRYIEGERARFVSPMAVFLFSVFLMFAVFQALGISAPTDIQPSEQSVANIEDAGAKAREEAATARKQLQERLDELPADSPLRPEVEADLANLDAAETILNEAETAVLGDTESSSTSFSAGTSGIPFIDNAIKKWRSNPDLMLYKLQANGYKFSWLLIPLSIPFVWLMFAWKRRFKAYDHAIFVTYSLSFMSMLFIALSCLGAASVEGILLFIAATTIAPIHLYKHLKNTYGLSRFSTVWRLVLTLIFIMIVLTLFLQILLLLGAF